MSISDRLDQIERESVEANEQWDCGRSAFNADNHAPPIDAALVNGERTLAALRAVLDLCNDPGGPDSWTHTFEGRPSVFVDDIEAAIAAALGEES